MMLSVKSQVCRRIIRPFRYDTRDKCKAKLELSRLAESRADLDRVLAIKDDDFPTRSWTLFHHAVKNGWFDVIDQLLTQQFKVDDPSLILDKDGYNILHVAIINDHPEIAAYLRAAYKISSIYRFRFPHFDVKLDLAIQEEYRNVKRHLKEIEDQGHSDHVEYLKDKAQKQQALVEALSENISGNFHLNNIIMHGPAEAGKTCVQKLILGEPPPADRRTPIIENAVRAVRFIRARQTENLGEIKVIDYDELIDIIASTIMDYHQKSSSNEQPTRDPLKMEESDQSERHTLEETELQESPEQAQIPSRHGSKIDTTNSVVMNDIKTKAKTSDKLQKMIFSLEWYHIFDSGGQPQFLDLLPLIFQNISLTIVVIRLTDDLHEKKMVCISENSDGETQNLAESLLLTNYKFIQMTCETAAARGSMVMIVATHRDQLGGKADKIVDYFNQSLKDIGNKFEKSLILPSKSVDKIIFDLNAISEGEERQKTTEKLQKCINHACENARTSSLPAEIPRTSSLPAEIPRTSSLPAEIPRIPAEIPLKWIVFQLKLFKELNDVNVIDIEKCYNSAAKPLGMDKPDMNKALRYLTDAGLLLHISNDVPVLTKFDPLIDKLSQLVLASNHLPNPTSRPDCMKLCNSGLFKQKFLEEVFKNLNRKCHNLDNNTFLKIIVCLRIAMRIGDEYFLPSALAVSLPPSTTLIKMECTPIAYFWNMYLPHGFFFTVIIYLMEESQSFQFKLADRYSQHRSEIRMCEDSNKIPGVIQLTNRNTWIQVSTSSSKQHCPTIHQLVSNAIERTIEHFRQKTVNVMKPPEITYICPSCKTQDHYCILTPNSKEYSCSVDRSVNEVVDERMLCWLSQQCEATDSEQGSIEEVTTTTTDQQDTENKVFTTVVDEISKVVNWKMLGLALKLEKYQLDEISKNHNNVSDRRKAMIQLWLPLATNKEAPWMELCRALRHEIVGEKNLAKRLEKKYHHSVPPDILVITALLMVFLGLRHAILAFDKNSYSIPTCIEKDDNCDHEFPTKFMQLERNSDDLDLVDVLEEVVQVVEWEQLGLALGVKNSKLEKIKKNIPSDVTECLMETLSHWLKNDDEATWKKLCSALEKEPVGHNNLARRIYKKRIKSNGDNSLP